MGWWGESGLTGAGGNNFLGNLVMCATAVVFVVHYIVVVVSVLYWDTVDFIFHSWKCSSNLYLHRCR